MTTLTGVQLILYEDGCIELDIPKPDFWWFCPECEAFHPGYHGQHWICPETGKEEE